MIENEQATNIELARVRGIAEREQLRLTAELAKEVAGKGEIEKRLAASSETRISRSDANKVFLCQSEEWRADEQRLNAEHEMKLAQVKSEAQIHSLQSAGYCS